MRSKVAFAIVTAGLLAFAVLLALRPNSRSSAASPQDSTATAGASTDPLGGTITGSGPSANPPRLPAAGSRRLYARSAAKRGTSSPDQQEIGLTPEQQEDAVNERILELSDLATRGDSASLGIVLSELTNDNADIRRAALDAVMQSGN